MNNPYRISFNLQGLFKPADLFHEDGVTLSCQKSRLQFLKGMKVQLTSQVFTLPSFDV